MTHGSGGTKIAKTNELEAAMNPEEDEAARRRRLWRGIGYGVLFVAFLYLAAVRWHG
jgi:hypothetical protein